MGFDYYIITQLEIELGGGDDNEWIEVKRDGRYEEDVNDNVIADSGYDSDDHDVNDDDRLVWLNNQCQNKVIYTSESGSESTQGEWLIKSKNKISMYKELIDDWCNWDNNKIEFSKIKRILRTQSAHERA